MAVLDPRVGARKLGAMQGMRFLKVLLPSLRPKKLLEVGERRNKKKLLTRKAYLRLVCLLLKEKVSVLASLLFRVFGKGDGCFGSKTGHTVVSHLHLLSNPSLIGVSQIFGRL